MDNFQFFLNFVYNNVASLFGRKSVQRVLQEYLNNYILRLYFRIQFTKRYENINGTGQCVYQLCINCEYLQMPNKIEYVKQI